MKKFVIAGTLAGAVAMGGMALAQQPPQTAPAAMAPKAKKATKTTDQGDANAAGTHTAPKQQPNTAEDAKTADQAMALGTVHLPAGLKADGKDLPAGTYQVRLTADAAKPDATGASQTLERWVEFVKAGKVAGREVVSIVPANEAKLVQKDTPPPAGGSKVQALKGGDYTRVWINKGGTYYLVHLAKS